MLLRFVIRAPALNQAFWVGEDQAAPLPTRDDSETGVIDELDGSDGTCDEVLNPLTISHTPINSSHRPGEAGSNSD